ncbi:MAG: alpha/beta hydrolase [Rhodospirillaceae bacterium]|jgi:pimeloyl-ACP methyl ester carboxylesterase|nr:alpha/beta hydrolase [Rhodospirillaceae bacterium]MBT5241399.1 alpha/beta hydrolase [Rhodospirillaceae bacterium]MBT6090680.1 alpha/beta hydrolase [Rhodospirillaceae bacterium]MBT6961809.1 alpha/beta hydrolase [Rhodospirillaceae bacterium]MBT7449427.1 alpha/beta hydrolase [Rhodospirillaceae bacterium]
MTPRRGYADGPYGQIHFQDTGPADTALVLCSQSPLTSGQFDYVYPLLAEAGIRTIGIDTVGFGMSDPPPGPPTIGDFATSIPAVLDHLDIEKAHVGGHHTGCKIAMEAAIAFRDRVQSVVLSGPGPMSREEQLTYIDTVLEAEKSYTAKADGTHLSDMFVKRYSWIKDHPDGLNLCTGYIVQQLIGRGPFWYGHHAAFNYDGAEAMLKLTQPALALFNTGDMLYPLAEKTRNLCPHFAYAELEGGGVDITDQNPSGWVREVSSFIFSEKTP